MTYKKGFTLIELLIVIAIIALLLTLLIPALQQAKDQAKNSFCLNNLHQIGIGVRMYADDNKEYIPRNTGHSSLIWILKFMPYLGHHSDKITDYREVKIYNCPKYPDPQQTIDYVLNSWSDTDNRERIGATKISVFKYPDRKIYLADNEDGPWRSIIRDENDIRSRRGQMDVWHLNHLSTGPDGSRRVAKSRHKEGCNAVFLDCHSEYIRADKMHPRMWRED